MTVVNPQSQKFYILGEVQKTGEYPIVKNLTVMQAFAIAGGFTEWASKDEIVLVRNEGGNGRFTRSITRIWLKAKTSNRICCSLRMTRSSFHDGRWSLMVVRVRPDTSPEGGLHGEGTSRRSCCLFTPSIKLCFRIDPQFKIEYRVNKVSAE